MHFDDLYQYTGQIGVYQICVLILIFGFDLFALDSTTMIFVGADMPHWCRVEALANLSFDRQKDIGIPYSGGESQGQDQQEYSSCKMYDLNYSAYSDDELYSWNRTLMIDESTPVIECTHWIYDQSTFVSTIVSRFDLVCELSLLVELVSSVYMVGSVISSIVSGIVADRYGRKPAIVTFLAIEMVGIFMSSFAPNYVVFVIGRFVLGVGSIAVYTSSYVFMMESIGPDYRAFVGCALQVSTSLGFMTQPLIASSVRDDRLFQLASMSPIGVFFTLAFIVEESPRWLVVTRRYHRAHDSIRRMCVVNNKSLPRDLDLTAIENDEETASCTVLLTLPRLRLRTIVLHIIFFISSLLWFSLSLNTGNLQGDIFTNTVISAALEIPSIILTNFLLEVNFIGRRFSCSTSFLLTGLACFTCIPMILYAYDDVVTGLAIFAKSIATASYTIVFIYASEIFPTEVRNSAMGSTMMMACVANIIAPYIGEPLSQVWKPLPYVILGSCAFIAGASSLVLPETLGQPLPDTAQEAENFTGKTNSSGVTTIADNKACAFSEEEPELSNEQPVQHQQHHDKTTTPCSKDAVELNNFAAADIDPCAMHVSLTNSDSYTHF